MKLSINTWWQIERQIFQRYNMQNKLQLFRWCLWWQNKQHSIAHVVQWCENYVVEIASKMVQVICDWCPGECWDVAQKQATSPLPNPYLLSVQDDRNSFNAAEPGSINLMASTRVSLLFTFLVCFVVSFHLQFLVQSFRLNSWREEWL